MLTTATCRAAVIGSPVGHSLSPRLHEAAYEALHLSGWSYARVAVGGEGEPGLAEFLDGLGPEWVGLSVTMPLKEEALAVADVCSGRARELGAANTLVRGEQGWIADSTDGVGVLEALEEAGTLRPRSVLLLGAGATARSVLDAVARLGARRVTFAVRDRVRPETDTFARRLGLETDRVPLGDAEGLRRGVAGADVTVSTLPTGTDLGLPPAGAGEFGGRLLMDVVYGGWPTPLARWAEAGGARVVSGLPMLVHQAAEQVRLMTGLPAPLEAMRAAVAGDG